MNTKGFLSGFRTFGCTTVHFIGFYCSPPVFNWSGAIVPPVYKSPASVSTQEHLSGHCMKIAVGYITPCSGGRIRLNQS